MLSLPPFYPSLFPSRAVSVSVCLYPSSLVSVSLFILSHSLSLSLSLSLSFSLPPSLCLPPSLSLYPSPSDSSSLSLCLARYVAKYCYYVLTSWILRVYLMKNELSPMLHCRQAHCTLGNTGHTQRRRFDPYCTSTCCSGEADARCGNKLCSAYAVATLLQSTGRTFL